MSFEDVMMKRLASCHAEACKEILAGVKSGRSLSDAVTDAIEALPASKTRALRRWLEDWEAWEEWKRWEAKGWLVKKAGTRVYAIAPELTPNDGPSDKAIAAAAGVPALKYEGDSGGHGKYTVDAKTPSNAAEPRQRLGHLGWRRRLVTQYRAVKRA